MKFKRMFPQLTFFIVKLVRYCTVLELGLGLRYPDKQLKIKKMKNGFVEKSVEDDLF